MSITTRAPNRPSVSILRAWSNYHQLQEIEILASECYRTVGYDPFEWGTTSLQSFALHDENGLLWVATLEDEPLVLRLRIVSASVFIGRA